MTPKGGSHDPEKPAPLPAKAATADLRTLVDQLVKLGLDFAAEALPALLTERQRLLERPPRTEGGFRLFSTQHVQRI